MNGDEIFSAYDDTYVDGTVDYGGFGQDTGDSIFSGFLAKASQKFEQVISRPDSRPTRTADGIGGGIFDAIYQYGAGRVELALKNAITGSKAGQQAIQNIERERIIAYIPWIIGASILLLIFGAFLRRK